MKKMVKSVLSVLFAASLLTSFIACDDGGDDPYVEPKSDNNSSSSSVTFDENGIGNIVTFNVIADSTGTSNKIILRYLRSAAGAKEKITLSNATYYIQHNNNAVEKKTGDLTFSLNQYGSCFGDDGNTINEEGVAITNEMRVASGKYKTGSTELIDPETDAAEYQYEIQYAEKLKKGDTVKFQLASAEITGEGASAKSTILPKLKVVLVDADEKVDWYKELITLNSETVYPLVMKKDAVVSEGEDVDHGLLDADFNTLSWGTAVKIAASKFAGAGEGSKIIVTYKMNEDGDKTYHMFQLWNTVVDGDHSAFDEVSNLTQDGTYTKTLTAAEAALLVENGLSIQGNSVTVTKVVFEKGEATDPQEPSGSIGDSLTKTSVIKGLQAGENVWGSGTNTTANADGTYTVTHGTGWDPSGMATMPVCFGVGELTGFTHVVVELDASGFEFRAGNDEYPSFELKVEDENGNAKVINATDLFVDGVAEIPLESVTFIDSATKFTVNLRGTGSVILKDISKAK